MQKNQPRARSNLGIFHGQKHFCQTWLLNLKRHKDVQYLQATRIPGSSNASEMMEDFIQQGRSSSPLDAISRPWPIPDMFGGIKPMPGR
jgi:hypothetical protein